MLQEVEITVRVLHSDADNVGKAMIDKIDEVTKTLNFDVKEAVVVQRSDIFANVGNWRYPK